VSGLGPPVGIVAGKTRCIVGLVARLVGLDLVGRDEVALPVQHDHLAVTDRRVDQIGQLLLGCERVVGGDALAGYDGTGVVSVIDAEGTDTR
jgi:hypothetical protein